MTTPLTNRIANLSLNEVNRIEVSKEYRENSDFNRTRDDYLQLFFNEYINQGYKFEGEFSKKIVNDGGIGKRPQLNRIFRISIDGAFVKEQ